jgi:pimeloyl-ACP methyl ester carboxylesterase
MAIFVLVHGGDISTETWNRLTTGEPVYTRNGKMGGKCWDGTVLTLISGNHRAFAPTLKDEHFCNLIDHIEQVCALIIENDLRDIILVGHSYGGMVITGVADRMADRIAHLVYIDAALPDPGQSLFDIIAIAGIDPLSVPGLERVAPYMEKLQFNPEKIRKLPKTYILCTKSDFIAVSRVAGQKIASSGREWKFIELPTSHLPMASMPEKLYEILLEIARNNG